MPFSEYLADRVRQRLASHPNVKEKKMMGGLIFMVNDKMCIGVDKDRQTKDDRLMVRLGPEVVETALQLPGAREMDFTGKSMRGFVFVYPEGFDLDSDLDRWVQKGLDFNAFAKKAKGR